MNQYESEIINKVLEKNDYCGRWIREPKIIDDSNGIVEFEFIDEYSCSICGRHYEKEYDICPYCGAKMIKGEERMKSEMFIVTQEGYKLPVDTTSLPDDACWSFHQTVGLFDNDTILKPVWILELNKTNFTHGHRLELEFVKDVPFDHEPTQEEILYEMSRYGLSRNDIAFVRRGYELDTDFDD